MIVSFFNCLGWGFIIFWTNWALLSASGGVGGGDGARMYYFFQRKKISME